MTFSGSYVRDRINRKLDTLGDERLYQVLDFVEFMEGRYAEKPAAPASLFTRFAEGVEDQLRAGGVAASTIAETMGLLGKAMGVLGGVAETTATVASGVVQAARAAADAVGAPASGGAAAAPAGHGAAPGGAHEGGSAAPATGTAPPPAAGPGVGATAA